ncbi:YggT family protein [Fuscibacter oryzae]|uniref:YggT family protein n=1 Tax=Fuscibacter oryzae TaxID=2803939 RepID=A0A8J7MNG4_9RHOB|nr:YggT family protein [Fuscibacter oryzae]MBL4927026.1 YggT family protein [Fuscibacter oryzae]
MTTIFQVLLLIVDIAKWIVLANVIMSWLVNFQVLNLRQPIVSQIWYGLKGILEPIYAQIRRVVPVISGIDFAPLVLLIGIFALRQAIVNNMYALG